MKNQGVEIVRWCTENMKDKNITGNCIGNVLPDIMTRPPLQFILMKSLGKEPVFPVYAVRRFTNRVV